MKIKEYIFGNTKTGDIVICRNGVGSYFTDRRNLKTLMKFIRINNDHELYMDIRDNIFLSTYTRLEIK